MQVTLINYTQDARELLLFTKQTRLTMGAGLLEEIRAWPEERKQKELAYMLHTIESSWEFVNYVFSIEGVSRAFTHQCVRTRSAHYAQQSQRTVDMGEFEFVMPEALEGDDSFSRTLIGQHNKATSNLYQVLTAEGVNPQDARAILPTNVATNIIVGADLRTISHMAEVRLCSRTQGEYQNVFRLLRKAILAVHPWADPFIRVACAKRGVCQFPNYTECPIKPGIFNPENGQVWEDQKYIGAGRANHFTLAELQVREIYATWETTPIYKDIHPLTKSEIQTRWEGMKFEAVPRQSK